MQVTEVNPLTRTELKLVTEKHKSEYKKVPVALIDGELVVDSNEIINHLTGEDAVEAAAARSKHADRGK